VIVFPSSQTVRLSRKAQIVLTYRVVPGSKPDVSGLHDKPEARPGAIPHARLRPGPKPKPRLYTEGPSLFNAGDSAALSRAGVERPESQPPIACGAGRLTPIFFPRAERAHLVSMDAPDLDPVETDTPRVLATLPLMDKIVLFYEPLEKYAGEVSGRFLGRVREDGGSATLCSTRPTTGRRPRTSRLEVAGRRRPPFRTRSVWGVRTGFVLVQPCAKEV